MTFRTLVASALVLLLGTTAAVAQQQTGEIYGRAADNSGAVLPGATVTVAGPALIQPRVAVTSETTQNVVVVNLTSGTVEQAIATGAAGSHMIGVTADVTRSEVSQRY